MQTSAAEMKLLSKRFYGNKYYFIEHHNEIIRSKIDQQKVISIVQQIIPEYSKELNAIDSNLFNIFISYLISQITFGVDNKFDFVKTTCLVELSVYIFQKAWDKRWNKEKTFEEFKQILVRHSLFRPPHSIYIFNLNEIKSITYHFISTFFRYYSSYFYVFTPLIDIEVRTKEVEIVKDAREQELDALRKEGEQYDAQMDPQLLQSILAGNSIYNVSAKKKEEIARKQREKENQERIDRVLKAKLEELEQQFELKIKQQEEEFIKQAEEAKNPKKK